MTPTDNPIPSHFEYSEKLAGAPGALIFFRPPFIHQKQIGANKVTPTDNPILSHFEYPEMLAGAPGDLISFRPPFIHQKQTGANKERVVRHQLLSSYSVPGGVPSQGDACRGVLHTPSYHSRMECLRVGGSFVPFRGTYKGAYSICPYPAGRKKNQCPSGLSLPISFKKTYISHQPIPIKKINRRPSGLPIPISFKKTYTSYQPIPIKKINQCPSVFPIPISFKKTYTSHQPIPIKKINQCPSGLPIPIHFSNIVHHTLCFSFK